MHRLRQAAIDKAVWITRHFEGLGKSGQGLDQVTGNFDGEGVSLGEFQECLGQGSGQDLLRSILDRGGDKLIEPGRTDILRRVLRMTVKAAVAWGDSVSVARNKQLVVPDWEETFRTLLLSPQGLEVQQNIRMAKLRAADGLCDDLGLSTERSLAFMLDIVVQDGSIPRDMIDAINDRFDALREPPSEEEVLDATAHMRAGLCRAAYRADVLARKLCIAHGRGTVHGEFYNLERQPGIGDEPYFEDDSTA